MRVAFYAPLKAPDHPVPSGDRRMARGFVDLLADMGHEVELGCHFRSYDRDGDAHRQQRLAALGQRLAEALLRRYRRRPVAQRPQMWFTYHLYHKAPDLLGPTVSRSLRIPYVVAEASIAGKQTAGRWAAGHAASVVAIGDADIVLAMTRLDLPGLEGAVADRGQLELFPPFLDAAPFVAAGGTRADARRRLAAGHGLDPERPWLLAVAMMRHDIKLLSFRLLAQALAHAVELPWQILLVGDGPARGDVEALFAPFGDRVRFLGALRGPDLPEIYAAADLYVWPACNEAYGMALLEAQAAGLPVVAGAEGGVADVVADGIGGCLVKPRSPADLAQAVRALLLDPSRRLAMGRSARLRVLHRHTTRVAGARLAAAMAKLEAGMSIGADRCASA